MKSVFGLDEKMAAALSYVFGIISGIIVLVMERENKFVRFHAMQSTFWFMFVMVIVWILRFVANMPIIGWLLGWIISPILAIIGFIVFISWVFLIVKALNGDTFKLPIIGDIVWSQINKK